MSARPELNGAHAAGSFVAGGLPGPVTGTTALFPVDLGGLSTADALPGNIGPGRDGEALTRVLGSSS